MFLLRLQLVAHKIRLKTVKVEIVGFETVKIKSSELLS